MSLCLSALFQIIRNPKAAYEMNGKDKKTFSFSTKMFLSKRKKKHSFAVILFFVN